MVKTTRKRISLFRLAEEDAVSPEQVELSKKVREQLTLIVSGLDGQIDSYEKEIKEPMVAAKQEIETISGLVAGDSEQALTKLLALVGIIAEPKVEPAPADGQVPVPGADAAMPVPPAPGGTSPPSKEEKGKVDELKGQTGDQAKALTEILKEAPQSASPGGGAKMPTGQMSMRDIIKMAVNKSAADPPPPATPPMPGAPPIGGDPNASGASTPTIKLEKIISVIGDVTAESDKNSFASLVQKSLVCAGQIEKSPYNTEYDTDSNEKIDAIKTAADKVVEQSLTVTHSVEAVVASLRKLCNAVEGNDVSGSAGELKSQVDGLKSYLESKWPKEDQLDENNTPENSEE